MKNSPLLKYALSLVVLSGISIPLAAVAGVWSYDNAQAAAQPASEAAPPRSGLEGPIRTETMELSPSPDAGTVYELGQIQQSSGEASSGQRGAESPLGKDTTEIAYP